MFKEFSELSISIRCRHGCGKLFNSAPGESRHANHHCRLNPTKTARRVKKRVCPHCQKSVFNLKRHLEVCKELP